jgi:hypothetical protein
MNTGSVHASECVPSSGVFPSYGRETLVVYSLSSSFAPSIPIGCRKCSLAQSELADENFVRGFFCTQIT